MGYTLFFVLLAIIVGAGIGFVGEKASNKVSNKLLGIKLKKVIDGKIPNKFEIDGKKVNVNTFILRTESGKGVKVNLCGEQIGK